MNREWFLVVAVMLLGSIFKSAAANEYIWALIDLLVLLVLYFILKRQPLINLKKSMLFLSALTIVNILVDLGILSAMINNLVFLALLGWILFTSVTRKK